MALTGTSRFSLPKHDSGDIDWGGDLNGAMDGIDSVLALLYADGTDDTPGTLSQKVDLNTLTVDTTAHKAEAVPIKIINKLYAVDSSATANSITVAPNKEWISYEAGNIIIIKLANTLTDAATITVDSLTSQAVKNKDGSVLSANQMLSGSIYILAYDGTDFRVLNAEINTSGKIGQLISTTKTDTFTTTSTTWVDVTGLSITITPAATSSKILIQANVNTGNDVASGWGGCQLRLVRDSTNIVGDALGSCTRASAGGMNVNSDQQMFNYGFHDLDNPATTSAVTYKIQIQKVATYGTTVYINRSGLIGGAYNGTGISSLTAMEVLA